MTIDRIGDATVYNADVMDALAALPDESVHTVITSPPYWGLRDYGTGRWEGGEPTHNHVGMVARTVSGGAGKQYTNEGSNRVYSGDCECGAHRIDQQIGLEATPEGYIAKMVAVFREVKRVLRDDGTAWVNLGDTYATAPSGSIVGGLKPKDLCGVPWRFAFALQADGWYLRSDIIWSKPDPMPESVTDRPTKSHEYVFLLSKSARYFYDAEAIKETSIKAGQIRVTTARGFASSAAGLGIKPSGNAKVGTVIEVPSRRNRRTVWTIPTEPFPGSHFATFPRALVKPCLFAGCPEHACPKCGAPWVREVEKSRTFESGSGKSGNPINGKWTAIHGGRDRLGPTIHVKTIGEHPTCDCGLPPIGGTVLDPFAVSGTVGEVALEYSRRAVLIELNREYCEMIRKRLEPVAARPLLDFGAL